MFFTSEQAQMTPYLSMLKTNTYQFVSTQRYGSLAELPEAARRREIEMELQSRDPRQALPIHSQQRRGSHPVIQDLEARGVLLVESAARFTRVLSDHLLDATNVEENGTLRGIFTIRPQY